MREALSQVTLIALSVNPVTCLILVEREGGGRCLRTKPTENSEKRTNIEKKGVA